MSRRQCQNARQTGLSSALTLVSPPPGKSRRTVSFALFSTFLTGRMKGAGIWSVAWIDHSDDRAAADDKRTRHGTICGCLVAGIDILKRGNLKKVLIDYINLILKFATKCQSLVKCIGREKTATALFWARVVQPPANILLCGLFWLGAHLFFILIFKL